MDDKSHKSSSHAAYSLKLHRVFVTQYRRKSLTTELLNDLHEAFADILEGWRCTPLEFGGEADHVHILVEIHPALNIPPLINNLKTASARRARNRFADHLKAFYWKPYFWQRAYDVGSVGGATLEIVRRSVESQGAKEKPARPQGPHSPLLAFGPERGMRGRNVQNPVRDLALV